MSHFPIEWNLDSLQATENDLFDDDESELSDVIKDIDMDPFESDHASTSNPSSQYERFSVQYLLPLEVRSRSWLCTLPYAVLMSYRLSR
jgi:hypothetical protein